MRKYELAIILHPDLELDLKPALKKIEQLVGAVDGKIVNQDNWGKQKLAYPIKKQGYGVYIFYTVELEGDQVQALENGLRIDDEVIRHLLVGVDEKALAAVAKAAADSDNKKTAKEK